MYEIIETAHVLKTPGHTLEIYKNVWIQKKKKKKEMYGFIVKFLEVSQIVILLF